MPDPAPPDPDRRPKLQSFVRLQYDDTRERWVLQAPERVLVLDETGKDIVVLCDGKLSIGAIVERFVAVYDAPRDVISHDVNAVIQLLNDKGMLVIQDRPAGERADGGGKQR
jgi:pyrroloquinoline quinone biosynthesis protein D